MFTHLHVHSYYSLLNAIGKPDKLVKKAKEYGMTALAITDYGTMSGAIEFYNACKAEDIKPIIGLTAYMTEAENITVKMQGDLRHQLILLAKDKEGYKNLMKLMSKACLEGFYYVPRIDRYILKEFSKGLICLSGTLSGELGRMILVGKSDEEILEKIRWYQDIFGEDFYLEISHHPEVENFKIITEKFIELSNKYNIPKVAAQQIFYIEKAHKEAHEVMLCIRDDKTIDDVSRFSLANGDYSFLTNDEMSELFKDTPDALENTIKIAEKCNIDLTNKTWVLPDIPIRDDCKTIEETLEKEVMEGITRRLERPPNESELARLKYEMDVINQKGFTSYILLVKKITDYMRNSNIANSTRGSAAGSFVTYALDITRANPLFFDLPFERFLNPLRPKAPDIDLDIEDRRRDDIIQWTRQTFGEENVAQIITFGTLSAKNAIKDIARVFKRPFSETNEITKLVPVKWGKTDLRSAIDEVPELKKMYETDPEYTKIFDIALILERCPRHASVHAAGVVITPDRLDNYVPLARDSRSNMPVTQYDMNRLEDLALLKMDYLGLRNLSIITDCLEAVQKRRNIIIDIEDIPLDDKKAYQLFEDGNTFGLFQLESPGMKRYLKELRPSSIFDIQAMVALYRPGPLENIPEYIARKNDPSKITYLHPDLEPIIKRTYGVIVYQDDVLLIAIKMAGYSWADADRFRKGMGKKIAEVIQAERETFISGCINNGYEKDLAEKMFELFGPFAGYGFNKSHAAAYALIAYQTAYLKANFTIEYMAALLQSEADNVEKTTANIAECENMGIEILPPDINESFTNFTSVTDNKIRFGLMAIKGLGIDTVKAIIKERKETGKYLNIEDFLRRVHGHIINRKSMESLILSGAFDNLEERNKLLTNLEIILEFSKSCQTEAESGQSSLFDAMEDTDITKLIFNAVKPASNLQKLEWEKQILGLYISGHPLDGMKNYLRKKGELNEKLEPKMGGTTTTLVGLIRNLRLMKTKKNEDMACFSLEDPTGETFTMIFPKYYNIYANKLENGKLCTVTGELQYRKSDGSYTILGREVALIPLDKAIESAKSTNLYSDAWKVRDIRKAIQLAKNDTVVETKETIITTNEDGDEEQIEITVEENTSEDKVEIQEIQDVEIVAEPDNETEDNTIVNPEYTIERTDNNALILILNESIQKDKLLNIKELLDQQSDGDKDFLIQIANTKIPYSRKIDLDEYFETDLNEILIS